MAFGFVGKLYRSFSGAKSTVYDRFIAGDDVTLDDSLFFSSHLDSLQVAVVLACARALAEDIAKLPLNLHRRTGKRTSEIASDERLYRLLHTKPSSFQNSLEWRETLMLHAVLTGTGFSFVNRVPHRGIAELIALPSECVAVQPAYAHEGRVAGHQYHVQAPNQGIAGIFSSANIFSLRGPSYNTISGLDITSLTRRAISLAATTQLHQLKFFEQGSRLSGVIEGDKPLSREAAENLAARWRAAYAGVSNHFKAPVLDNGLKFKPITSSNNDAQLVQTRELQIREICMAFGVHPQRIGANTQTNTYASAESFRLAYLTDTLQSWVSRWEMALNTQLLPEDTNLFFKFNMTALLRSAQKDRSAFYFQMHQMGALSPNEIREYEDMDPYEGGDVFMRPLNMGPIPADAVNPTVDPSDEVKPDDRT